MKLIVPIVHSNGTSRDSLMEQYSEAAFAITKAMDALSKVETHDRDYYVHPTPRAGVEARNIRNKWFQMLKTIKSELTEIAVAIQKNETHTKELPDVHFTVVPVE
jgi:hypothetical protein